jgi:hypothetical protein
MNHAIATDHCIETVVVERQGLGITSLERGARHVPPGEREEFVGEIEPDNRRTPFLHRGGKNTRSGTDVEHPHVRANTGRIEGRGRGLPCQPLKMQFVTGADGLPTLMLETGETLRILRLLDDHDCSSSVIAFNRPSPGCGPS